MSEARSLKIALTKTDLKGKYGDDIEFTADLSTVKEAIIGAAGAVGLENCLKFGAVATAFYLVVRSIKTKWSWLNITNVEKDVLEVSVPREKEKRFSELMKNNIIEEKLVQEFKKLSANLEDILEEDSEQYRKDVLEQLKDFRIKSIREKGPDLPENLIAREVILGNVDQKITDRHELMTVEEAEGSVIGTLVGSGATLKQEIHGGSCMMSVRHKGDDLEKVVDAHQNLAAGECVPVKIFVEETEKTFEKKFKPTATVKEVILALKKEKEKRYRIFRDDIELKENLTLAQAARDGSTVNWTAQK